MAEKNSYIKAEEMNSLINTYKDLYAYAESTSQPSVSVSKNGISYATAINTVINGMNNLKTKYGTAFASYTSWKTKVAQTDYLKPDIFALKTTMESIRQICKNCSASGYTESPSVYYSPDVAQYSTKGCNNTSNNKTTQSYSQTSHGNYETVLYGGDADCIEDPDTGYIFWPEDANSKTAVGNNKTEVVGDSNAGNGKLTGYYEDSHSGNSRTAISYSNYSY